MREVVMHDHLKRWWNHPAAGRDVSEVNAQAPTTDRQQTPYTYVQSAMLERIRQVQREETYQRYIWSLSVFMKQAWIGQSTDEAHQGSQFKSNRKCGINNL